MSQGVMRDERGDVGQFGRFGAQEFSPRGGIEEEIGDRDGGATGYGIVVDVQDLAPGNLQARSGGVLAGGGFQCYAGYGSDRGQCLAAESQGSDGQQVVGGAQLGGGVALE